MPSVLNKTLALHREAPRIYIDSNLLDDCIVDGNLRYDRDWQDHKLILIMNPNGKYTLSTKTKDSSVIPVLDINTRKLNELFNDAEMLRVAIMSGRIIISAHAQAGEISVREDRLRNKLKNGIPLDVGSQFHGGGTLDVSMHKGFENAGVKATTSYAIEIEGRYLESSRRNNKQIFNPDTIFINSDIALVNHSAMKPVEIILAGLPCQGASVSGKAKNKLKHSEDHSQAGVCFFSFLSTIRSCAPSIIVIENVKQYLNTASFSIISSVLGQMKYVLKTFVLDGKDYGSFEHRQRMVCIAISEGIASEAFFDQITNQLEEEKSNYSPTILKDLLSPMADDDQAWKEVRYLKSKEVSDRKNGKGFRMQILETEAKSCGVIGSGYAKSRSTEPRLIHPKTPDLSRLFTTQEHAKIKSLDPKIVDGLPQTIGHQILGNGVIGNIFKSVGFAIGKALSESVKTSQSFKLVA